MEKKEKIANIRGADFDTIINLPAENKDDNYPISKYDEVNVQGAENICIYGSVCRRFS